MRLEQPRLNAAHFLLASMLGVQPGKNRPSKLFKTSAAFSRLILTTNFDPFLQTALQLVNRLYFMSDTPELGVSDEIFDDAIDAVHLVYVHGSIHRRSQAATDQEIQALKKKNAGILAPVLKRHGVIVLGYSGWDDAIVEALAACDRFDHRLYWCGQEPDPIVPGAFGPRVAEILSKPSAFYVPITGAGRFMARLCNHLVQGLPRLLSNPIDQLRDLLASIDLKELESSRVNDGSVMHIDDGATDAQVFVQAKQTALTRLQLAEQVFHAPMTPTTTASGSAQPEKHQPMVVPTTENEARVTELLASARLAGKLENYQEALRLCDEALALPNLKASDKADIMVIRGVSNHAAGYQELAIDEWTRVLDLQEAPIESVSTALLYRGFTWGQKGDSEKEVSDYSRIIDKLPGAPVGMIARALLYRGFTWGQKGDPEREVSDYSRIIDKLPGAPVELMAEALGRRGAIRGKKGDTEEALADYSRIIDQLTSASVEQIAKALVSRGITWGKKGDTEKALADYSHIIDQLPGASVEQTAKALVNRGIIWDKKGDTAKALADCSRVIDQLPGAPVEYIAQALVSRGAIWDPKGDIEKKLEDYSHVIDHLPGAPIEYVAQALVSRGATWGLIGDTERKLVDYSRVIDRLPGAPVECVALALVERGVTWGKKGDTDKALADCSRVIEHLPGAPVEEIAHALLNRGIAWGRKGATEKALADLSRLIDQLPGASIEQVAQALLDRGTIWDKSGDTEKALADFSRLIDQLPMAPVEYLAKALCIRGFTWGKKGDTEKALADYSRLIDQRPGAPDEWIARAMAGRAWLRYVAGDFSDFLKDTQSALARWPSLDFAEFNLGLGLLACGKDADALKAYRRAGEKYPQEIEKLGFPDLVEAQKTWLTPERAGPVVRVLQGLKN